MTAVRRSAALCGLALALVLTACGGSDDDATANEPARTEKSSTAQSPTPSATPTATEEAHEHAAQAAPVRRKPLRAGERRITLKMPADYTPSAPTGVGTDDYRCFLLDPELARNQMITGYNVLPGNPEVVHHVILFRVPAELVPEAEQTDEETPGQGWTCFGGSGIGERPGQQLDDAPWLGAWAPGGAENVYGKGFGAPFGKGSRVVMQVHYNLLAGKQPDRSATELRITRASPRIQALQTRLLPAPVELPCRPEHDDGPLCDRADAVEDARDRFGTAAGLADALHLLCGPIKAGPVQSCTRPVAQPETVRGVAGHMHLLGQSIKVEVNPGKPDARTLLDIPVWDFDDQGSRPVPNVKLEPFDEVKVTCRHTQDLRDRLPAFEGQPDRYVVWGEGTTDEMCLAILLVTRP